MDQVVLVFISTITPFHVKVLELIPSIWWNPGRLYWCDVNTLYVCFCVLFCNITEMGQFWHNHILGPMHTSPIYLSQFLSQELAEYPNCVSDTQLREHENSREGSAPGPGRVLRSTSRSIGGGLHILVESHPPCGCLSTDLISC